jgi:hypothetical protein
VIDRVQKHVRNLPVRDGKNVDVVGVHILVGFALADGINEEAGPPEVEIVDGRGLDLGPPQPEAKVSGRVARSRIRSASPAEA